MARVLVLGANGQLVRPTSARLLQHSDAALTLCLRHSNLLKKLASLAGDLAKQAKNIVAADGRSRNPNTSSEKQKCKSEN